MAGYEYRLLRGALCRRPSSDAPLEVLMTDGWGRCGPALDRYLAAGLGKAEDASGGESEEPSGDGEEASGDGKQSSGGVKKSLREDDVLRRARRACSVIGPDDPPLDRTLRHRLRLSLPIWWLSPPLPHGAPRFVDGRADDACAAFAESLPEDVTDDVIAEASAGLMLARERLAGIQSRAATLVQAAGLTSTLVLANGTLLVSGSDGPSEGAATIIAVTLGFASLALICTGVYGLAAVMWTFGRIAPDNTRRVIQRANQSEKKRRRQRVAAMLLAYRRTSLVGDWKLARLKRAVGCFVVTIAGVAVASGALVADSLL